MLAVRKNKSLLLGGAVLALVAVAAFVWLGRGPERLPYITPAGIKKLAFYDKQIKIQQGQGAARRTDLDYSVALATAVLDRGKVTGDGRDFDNATAIINDAEALIATRTRTEEGATRLPELFVMRARILAARHRFLEAREVAERALAKYPGVTELAGIAGEASVQAGDLNSGEAYLRKLVGSEYRVANNLIGLAYWAEISGDLEQAAELLARAPEVKFPKPLPRLRLAYVHAVQGDIQSKLGDLKTAQAYYEESLRNEPTFAQARSGIADLLQYQGKNDEAEAILRSLVETEWPNADYQVKLATLRERQGDPEEAKKLRRAAEKYYEWSVESGFEGYLRPLATLKLARGEYRAAAKYAARDLELRPNKESRAIYQNIYNTAQKAGEPLGENALDSIKADTTVIRTPSGR